MVARRPRPVRLPPPPPPPPPKCSCGAVATHTIADSYGDSGRGTAWHGEEFCLPCANTEVENQNWTDEDIDMAADVCAILASHPEAKTFEACLALGVPVEEKDAYDLANYTIESVQETLPLFEGDDEMEWTRRVNAEAEALLREHWSEGTWDSGAEYLRLL